MRAIALAGAGAAPALHDLPVPTPGPGEVLVRVQASSVNGFDLSVAAGRLTGMMEHHYPVVLGKDFAGIVEAVGADVSRVAAGDVVFGVVMKPVLGDGCAGRLAHPRRARKQQALHVYARQSPADVPMAISLSADQ